MRLQRDLCLAWMVISAACFFGCGQPKARCQTSRGDFAAKYTLVQGTGPCAELKGEDVGVQSYNYPTADGQFADLNRPSIALLPQTIGDLLDRASGQEVADPDDSHKPYGKGDFDSAEPGADEFCPVSKIAAAEQNLPVVPAVAPDPEDPEDKGQEEQPATKIKYAWSNFKVLVSVAHFGNQFVSDLAFSQDGCTATYRVWGLYPLVSCADQDGKPDDRLCSSEAIVEAGMTSGSGINPDYPTACDPDLLFCVLSKEPPAIK
jgi:hypothetical protein